MGQARRKDKSTETREPPAGAKSSAPPGKSQEPTAWVPPERLSRRGQGVLLAALVLAQLPLLHYALLRSEPEAPLAVPYQQDFSDPAVVERDFYSTGGHWRVVQGQLLSPGVKNNPLWLQARLPRDVAVEFDARSESPEGDIKVEIFGDGSDHASGYVLIHGGWNNSTSIIARLDEHGPSLELLRRQAEQVLGPQRTSPADLRDSGVWKPGTRMRVAAQPFPVERGRTYRWRIERRGSLLRWLIDGRPFMELDDPYPLEGKGHDRFGFSSWEAQLFFDNLKIEPL